jgi:hypothetical protein
MSIRLVTLGFLLKQTQSTLFVHSVFNQECSITQRSNPMRDILTNGNPLVYLGLKFYELTEVENFEFVFEIVQICS